jgi:hypothetical protein
VDAGRWWRSRRVHHHRPPGQLPGVPARARLVAVRQHDEVRAERRVLAPLGHREPDAGPLQLLGEVGGRRVRRVDRDVADPRHVPRQRGDVQPGRDPGPEHGAGDDVGGQEQPRRHGGERGAADRAEPGRGERQPTVTATQDRLAAGTVRVE